MLWLGSFSNDVFERRTVTGCGLFAILVRNFDQIFRQIVSMRVKALENTNSVASRHIKRENASTPVDVHRSKPYICLSSPYIMSVYHPAGCGKEVRCFRKNTLNKQAKESYLKNVFAFLSFAFILYDFYFLDFFWYVSCVPCVPCVLFQTEGRYFHFPPSHESPRAST